MSMLYFVQLLVRDGPCLRAPSAPHTFIPLPLPPRSHLCRFSEAPYRPVKPPSSNAMVVLAVALRRRKPVFVVTIVVESLSCEPISLTTWNLMMASDELRRLQFHVAAVMMRAKVVGDAPWPLDCASIP